MREGKWELTDAKEHIKESGHTYFKIEIGEKPLDWMQYTCLTCIWLKQADEEQRYGRITLGVEQKQDKPKTVRVGEFYD